MPASSLRSAAEGLLQGMASTGLAPAHRLVILAHAVGMLVAEAPSSERACAINYADCLMHAAERAARQARHDALLAQPAGQA